MMIGHVLLIFLGRVSFSKQNGRVSGFGVRKEWACGWGSGRRKEQKIQLCCKKINKCIKKCKKINRQRKRKKFASKCVELEKIIPSEVSRPTNANKIGSPFQRGFTKQWMETNTETHIKILDLACGILLEKGRKHCRSQRGQAHNKKTHRPK